MPGARADDDPLRLTEDIDDVDDQAETLAIAGAHVARLGAQLQHHAPSDPVVLERLQRERAYWQRIIDTITLEDHWAGGAGDRTLF